MKSYFISTSRSNTSVQTKTIDQTLGCTCLVSYLLEGKSPAKSPPRKSSRSEPPQTETIDLTLIQTQAEPSATCQINQISSDSDSEEENEIRK